MKPEEWEEVLRLHGAAQELPEEERVAFVLAWTQEGEVRREVLRLLEVKEPSATFMEPPPLDVPGVGRDLGDFTLLEEIGRGGMGVVYRAMERPLKRIVAVKVLPASFALSARQVDRFLREARSAARLSHPNLVNVFSVGEEAGVRYFAMEYVNGNNLADELRLLRSDHPTQDSSRTHLPSSRASTYFRAVAEAIRQVAQGLQHAHENGIVHRDIKPSNLLLDAGARVRIVDFGLVRDEELGSISTSGDLVGTPHYMSPEQARAQRHKVDHRTDIYSLGVVLYELLTLRRPFEGQTSQEVIQSLLEREPPSIRRLNPRVPRDLETICLKAMARDPQRRYPSAAELDADLARFLAHEGILARPPALLEQLARKVHRHRVLLSLGAIVAVASAAGAVLMREALARRALQETLVGIRAALAEAPLRELPPGRQAELRGLLRAARASGGVNAMEREAVLVGLERDFRELRDEIVRRGRADLDFARDPRQPQGAREDRRLSGLIALARGAQLFPEDEELARLATAESVLPTLSVRAVSFDGSEIPASVSLREVDVHTSAVGPRRSLGDTPLGAVPLLPGYYRVVVEFRAGGFRELVVDPGPARMVLELLAVRREDEDRIGEGMAAFAATRFTFSAYSGEDCFQGREVALAAFALDRTEVTNADYARFVTATGHPAPAHWTLEPDRDAFLAAAGTLPVVGVTWLDAVAYSEWSGKRLPTMAEWHLAAAGREGRPTPYSADPAEAPRGNVRAEDGTAHTTLAAEWASYRRFAAPVDSYSEAASPEGVLHLFGNVDELTESLAVTRGGTGELEPRSEDRFVIGGWWEAAALGRQMLMPGYVGIGPNYATWHTGFRCARSLEP